MQRLPTEIYDLIIDYVAAFRDNPPFDMHLMHPPMHSPHKPALTASKNLRLVDRTLSRCASRALFRGVCARLGHGTWLIARLEKLSTSDYTKYVRIITFEIVSMNGYNVVQDAEDERRFVLDEDEGLENQDEIDKEGLHDDELGDVESREVDERGFSKLSDKALDHLSLLLAKFYNLKSINIWSDSFESMEYVMGFLCQMVTTIADLQFRGVVQKIVELRMPLDGANHLRKVLENDETNAAIRHLLQNVQHLDFIGWIDLDVEMGDIPTESIDLHSLIVFSPGLLSLTVFGDTALASLVKFDPSLSIRLESLELTDLKITAYDLLALLQQSKESMRFLYLDYVVLVSGTWLHVLFQMKKNLKLSTIFFRPSDPYFYGLQADGFGHRETVLIRHALGDLQRQTNKNRVAEGLERWPKRIYIYLHCPPLRHVMKKETYRELCSRKWDAESP